MTKTEVIQIVQAQARKAKLFALKDKMDGVAHGAIYALPLELAVKKIVGHNSYCKSSRTSPPAFCRDPKKSEPEEKIFYGLQFTRDLKAIAEITICQLLPHHSGYSPYSHNWRDQPDCTSELYNAFTIECDDGNLTHDELNSHLPTLE